MLGLGIPHTAPVPDSYLTVSIGLATQTPAIGSHSRQLISAADKGLYQAKNGGRNQVGIA
ncbi:Phytochrome-like protein cph2 [compost metagenome]